jgi:hypothetical protein
MMMVIRYPLFVNRYSGVLKELFASVNILSHQK